MIETPFTLFISDLHLCESETNATNAFLDLLSNLALNAEALYILGDFFELWVGDDDHNPFNQRIKSALKAYTKTGIPTFLMRGNRDFLLGDDFEKETGVTMIKDPTVIDLYGERVLLMHGDSLCTDDKQHQRIRKLMHSKVCKHIALSLFSLKQRQRLGRKYRSQSTSRKQTLASDIMDVNQDAVLQNMQTFDVKTLIHGHTHRKKLHEVTELSGRRIVLGDWDHGASYCIIGPNNKLSLI